MNKLDDYFDAYDKTYNLSGFTADWKDVRRRVRRTIARPIFELTGQVVFLIACLTWGIIAHPIGYILAFGALCFIPQYIGRVRKEIKRISELASDDELFQHLKKEGEYRMARAFTLSLYWAFLTIIFSITGAASAIMGKDWRSGVAAAIVAAIISGFSFRSFLFRSRECRAFDSEEGIEDIDSEIQEGHDGK